MSVVTRYSVNPLTNQFSHSSVSFLIQILTGHQCWKGVGIISVILRPKTSFCRTTQYKNDQENRFFSKLRLTTNFNTNADSYFWCLQWCFCGACVSSCFFSGEPPTCSRWPVATVTVYAAIWSSGSTGCYPVLAESVPGTTWQPCQCPHCYFASESYFESHFLFPECDMLIIQNIC